MAVSYQHSAKKKYGEFGIFGFLRLANALSSNLLERMAER
jgi:hypothetical protein